MNRISHNKKIVSEYLINEEVGVYFLLRSRDFPLFDVPKSGKLEIKEGIYAENSNSII